MAIGVTSGGSGRSGRRGRTSKPMSEPNVIPLVDVMLVLLIIFMVAAPLLTAGVKVDLPKTAASELRDNVEPLTISIQSSGKIFLQETETLPEPPKERARTKPVEKPAEKKPETFDLSKIAQSLNKLDKKPDSPAKPSNSPQAQPQPSPPQITNALEGGLSMSEKDALRAIIGRNWNVPTGAPRPEDLIVIVRFSLNPDGTLAGAPQLVNSGSYASNSFFRAAADAALRAVQMTQPFKLPANKYNDWREIVLTFDPRDMISSR